MDGIRLPHLLVAAGLLGLMIALMATLLILPEIQERRLLCEASDWCGTWTSVPGGRDILIVLIVTYLVPALTLAAGVLALPTGQTASRPSATRTESSPVSAFVDQGHRERSDARAEILQSFLDKGRKEQAEQVGEQRERDE